MFINGGQHLMVGSFLVSRLGISSSGDMFNWFENVLNAFDWLRPHSILNMVAVHFGSCVSPAAMTLWLLESLQQHGLCSH